MENVKIFVDMVSKYDVDIDLSEEDKRYVVDAKSILGVFSLNLARPMVLVIHDSDENVEKYRELLDKFEIKKDP